MSASTSGAGVWVVHSEPPCDDIKRLDLDTDEPPAVAPGAVDVGGPIGAVELPVPAPLPTAVVLDGGAEGVVEATFGVPVDVDGVAVLPDAEDVLGGAVAVVALAR